MAPVDAKTDGDLKTAFYAFASFGASQHAVEMEGKNFIKLCKDTKLMGKALTSTDIDLIFTKVKAKGARKITYDAFLKALDHVAAKKGCAVEEVIAVIIKSGGPENNGTQAEAVKWHDDKSLYTGVYAKGGPTNVDMDPTNLAGLCDRSAADVRGIKTGGSASGGNSRRSTADKIPAARRSTGEVPAAAGRRSTAESATGGLNGALKNMKI